MTNGQPATAAPCSSWRRSMQIVVAQRERSVRIHPTASARVQMRHELSASGHPVASFLEFMLHVRLATAADAALVARLGAALFAQAVAERNSAEDMRDYLTHAFGESVQARELADTNMRTWIAEDGDGVAVGYVQLRQESQPPVGSLQRPAELARIYSDARWHGR